MEIRTIELGQIKPASYNPRQDLQPGHPRYEAIRKSIDTWGLAEPLIWNESTGNLVGGHQRLKILSEMGRTTVDVSVVNLDPAAEKAMNVALNRAQGEWAEAELEQLAAQGLAQAATYTDQEIADLLLKLAITQGQDDYQALMGPAVERPDQPPVEERVEILLRAGADVLTAQRIRELRRTWSHLGVEIQIKKGEGAAEA